MLTQLKKNLEEREQTLLSDHACKSFDAIRREREVQTSYRLNYSVDCDRILHSKSYTRYIDKTQVFCLIKNDHITHRVLHVQLVSKIARTLGRYLGLNEDLIEAISLGHDIGHPPFGHDGEKILDRLCKEYGLAGFQHNIQSVHALEKLEKNGKGLNITLQTLDGILCHDGEIHNRELAPSPCSNFQSFDDACSQKAHFPQNPLFPGTFEGCVVRFSDTFGYIGRDIEDAIELKLLKRSDIPKQCRDVLGDTNGTIVYTLVSDLIASSANQQCIGMSEEVSVALSRLKEFNYEKIYMNPLIKSGNDRIREGYELLFRTYLHHIQNNTATSAIMVDFLSLMNDMYRSQHTPAEIVRDFLAGMTDDYFIDQSKAHGCLIPRISM